MQAKDIIFLVPTRGRPDSAKALIDAWIETESEAMLSFWIDDDDPELHNYRKAWDPDWPMPNLEANYVWERLRLAGTLNHAVAKPPSTWNDMPNPCDYKAIGFMGDDHRPRTKGWDQRFAECLSGGAGIVYGNDLLVGDRFPTAVCMTSDIPLTLGYICPPGFTHLCLDLVWKDWGEGMGRITYLDDVIIEHMHPANGKAQFDDRYAEVNSEAMVSLDTKAYVDYCEHGLASDIEKLKKLP